LRKKTHDTLLPTSKANLSGEDHYFNKTHFLLVHNITILPHLCSSTIYILPISGPYPTIKRKYRKVTETFPVIKFGIDLASNLLRTVVRNTVCRFLLLIVSYRSLLAIRNAESKTQFIAKTKQQQTGRFLI